MINHVSLVAGVLTGFAIAVPIGPMGLLCIQRTLAAGMAVGVCTGLGAATVNLVYSGAILLGLDSIAPWMAGSNRPLNACGGLSLLWSAVRTLRARQAGGGPVPAPAPSPPALSPLTLSPVAAYGSAVAFNATNPMALILIMALLTPIAGHATLGDAALFLGGQFAAVMTWWVSLTGAVALLRARLSPAILGHVNHAAGLLLTLYGVLALARSARM